VLRLVVFVFLARGSHTKIGRVHRPFHVTHFGGNANNGTNTGAFYWNVNNDSSNRNRNIGTRLIPLTIKC